MILVIGGAHQGKRKLVRQWMEEAGHLDHDCAEGAMDDFDAIGYKPVICGVEAYLRRCPAAGIDPDVLIGQILLADPQYVIMDEVGYGVVPVDAGRRAYRETAGRAGQRLAREAEAVYRVVCGIPVRIK